MATLESVYGIDSQLATESKVFLLSERTTYIGEKICISFIPNAEYPFEVHSPRKSFSCISWNEACDKYNHFYAFVGEPTESWSHAN